MRYFMLGYLTAVTVLALATACTARETARDAYSIQSKACVQIYDGNAPAQRSCLDYVRNKWTKAGAPAAAVDGGAP